ncbi:MAG: sodium:proton antiporter [Pseudomonadota bacterium]
MTQFRLRPRSALRELWRHEAAGGVLLMLAAAAALTIANSPAADLYFGFLTLNLGPLSVLHWINDSFMALFFLLVGLEIKRELLDGHLATWADRTLPLLAAVGGMAVPAVIYLALTSRHPELRPGWAIPAATDIAFALGVLSLLGSRVPVSLKLLLTTIAIVDDMGAVAIIAIGYTDSLSGAWLLASLAVMALLWGLNKLCVSHLAIWLAGFVLLWFAVLQSGIHATVAGVLAAVFVPVHVSKGRPDDVASPLHRLEHGLQLPVAFIILPLFGLANAGVALAGANVAATLPVAIAAALFFGKQLGIFGAIWLTVKAGWSPKPAGASWAQIYGLALLCGIGFTMSLFIGELAFDDPALGAEVKIGVLLGSLSAAILGAVILYLSGTKKEAA